MSYDSDTSSARLEREVEAQRHQVETRIDEIKERLSLGQLLDEALAYTKGGGSAFASNLGTTVSNNPLPTTLLGVSLAWLIAAQNKPAPQPHTHAHSHIRQPEYPYARISGANHLRRVSHSADTEGQWWSEFETDAGDRYKAKSNQVGERLGHFADKTGKMWSGFTDDAGNRISQFQDESGNALHEASGWASHTWSDITNGVSQGVHNVAHGVSDSLHNAAHGMSSAADGLGQQAQDMGRMMQKQSDQLTRQIGTLFEEQPLIAGALAFAAGAALGAALPHTREEDKLVGKASDDVRREAGHMAADAYESGKEQVGKAYQDASETAKEAYDEVKNKVSEGAAKTEEDTSGLSAYQRH